MTGSIKRWGTPEIQPLLIRDHFELVHLLAEPYAGRGRCKISYTHCYRKRSEKNLSGAGGDEDDACLNHPIKRSQVDAKPSIRRIGA